MNTICINRVASTILNMLSIKPNDKMAAPIAEILTKAKDVDRVFMYNPDAIAEWIYHKYEKEFEEIKKEAFVEIPMLSVMPSVTPACFGSMYSGLMPKEHGIEAYVKPVLKCRTIFDELIDAGKKVAIVSTSNDSISMIFLERHMDYFIFDTKEACNDKAKELIQEDKYDCIVLYNGDYDHWMHRFSPTGKRSIKALKENIATYIEIRELIKIKWSGHKTALAFAPDHGCHYVFGLFGNHGKNTEEDMNIVHFWTII